MAVQETSIINKIIISLIVIYSIIHILNKMMWNGNIQDKLMAYLTLPWSLI
jgi:hypothetical protein